MPILKSLADVSISISSAFVGRNFETN